MSSNYSVGEAKFTPGLFSDTNNRHLRAHGSSLCTHSSSIISHICIQIYNQKYFHASWLPHGLDCPQSLAQRHAESKVRVAEMQRIYILKNSLIQRLRGLSICDKKTNNETALSPSYFTPPGLLFSGLSLKNLGSNKWPYFKRAYIMPYTDLSSQGALTQKSFSAISLPHFVL